MTTPAYTPEQLERALAWLRKQVENMRFIGDFRPDHAVDLAKEFAAIERRAERKGQLIEHRLRCHEALLQYDAKGKLIGNLRCGKDWKCYRLIELEAK